MKNNKEILLLGILLSYQIYMVGASATINRTWNEIPNEERFNLVDIVSRNYPKSPELLEAASKGDSEMVNLLLKAGARIDTSDEKKETPLVKAVKNGHLEVVKILLGKGANKNIISKNGDSLLSIAQMKKDTEMIKLLLSNNFNDQYMDIDHIVGENYLRSLELLEAASEGDVDTVRQLLNDGVMVDVKDEKKETPLVKAMLNRHFTVARMLLEKGANPNATSKNGAPLLYIAVMTGNAEIVTLLLSYDSIRQKLDSITHKASLLHKATENGHTDVVRVLLNTGSFRDKCNKFIVNMKMTGNYILPNFPRSLVGEGRGLLHLAAGTNNVDLIKIFLELGAKVNLVETTSGDTPLHEAVYQDSVEVIEILLKAGANPLLVNNYGRSPLSLVKNPAARKIFKRYQKEEDVTDAMEKMLSNLALFQNNEKKYKEKIEEALLNASGESDIKKVRALLELAANANIKIITGGTVLHLSSRFGNAEIINLLLNAGAREYIDDKNVFGDTPLHEAIRSSNLEGVAELLKAGAKVDIYNVVSETPLYLAVKNGDIEIVRALLDKGADVNEKNYLNNLTPLHMAIKNGSIEVINMLLKAGAHIDNIDHQKGEPYFAMSKNKTMTQVLREHQEETVSAQSGGGIAAAAAGE